jgi:hypothetical protein
LRAIIAGSLLCRAEEPTDETRCEHDAILLNNKLVRRRIDSLGATSSITPRRKVGSLGATSNRFLLALISFAKIPRRPAG